MGCGCCHTAHSMEGAEEMRNTHFKAFKERVKDAYRDDPIWWAGYLWIDMTPKQNNTMFDLLAYRGMVEDDTAVLPSGIRFKRV